jgi:group I intron endonuclease
MRYINTLDYPRIELLEKVSGIYVITNEHTENRIHQYVGQSWHLRNRYNQHIKDLRCNKHVNQFLQNAFNKYGERAFTFEVLEIVKISDLSKREAYWIEYFGGLSALYNFQPVTYDNLVRGTNLGSSVYARLKPSIDAGTLTLVT